jgi:hypothetical protein
LTEHACLQGFHDGKEDYFQLCAHDRWNGDGVIPGARGVLDSFHAEFFFSTDSFDLARIAGCDPKAEYILQ